MSERSQQTRTPRVLLVEDNPGDVRLVEEGIRGVDTELNLHVQQNGARAIEWLTENGDRSVADDTDRSVADDTDRSVADDTDRSGDGRAPTVPPDLLLLDLNLPGKSGFEVLEAVREKRRFDEMPVVVVSSSENPADIRRVYAESANAYVTKPPDPDEYIQMIVAAVRFWIEHGTQTQTDA
jgi:CheY-like chemotaxis protein